MEYQILEDQASDGMPLKGLFATLSLQNTHTKNIPPLTLPFSIHFTTTLMVVPLHILQTCFSVFIVYWVLYLVFILGVLGNRWWSIIRQPAVWNILPYMHRNNELHPSTTFVDHQLKVLSTYWYRSPVALDLILTLSASNVFFSYTAMVEGCIL